jgi:catechol 2,3-dioxygenase-like lactoylglutathione lyase family enzyme
MDKAHYSRIRKMSPQLLVADLERSVEFYTRKLGFEIHFRYGDFYAGIIKDGCSIHLKKGKTLAEVKKNKRNNEHTDIVFSVQGIEDLYNDLSGESVEIAQTPRHMPYGKEFYVADPDGNIIAFLEEA